MHFAGRTWRPPYEANSVIIQAASGCTYGKCRFCSLYADECFRMSPMEEFEEDLAEIRSCQPHVRRIFWTGANPFAMSYENLRLRALTVRDYLIKFYSRRGEGTLTGAADIYPEFTDTDTPFCQLRFKFLPGHRLSAKGEGFRGQ